ncbi:MAG: adenylate/guanylate cyclase domain-containing protein [Alphaproteobacteria bacterium]
MFGKRVPGTLAIRLARVFVRDQREALMLAAKVRCVALIPIILWAASRDAVGDAQYWWQLASASVYLPTSLAHYFAARWSHSRFRAAYALFALDIVIMGVFFTLQNPFSTSTLSSLEVFALSPFFWFLFFLIHASYSANWRMVVWTGSVIALVRMAQLAWLTALPDTVTELDLQLATIEDFRRALANPNFLFLSNAIGDLIGVGSFTLATAFLVRRSRVLVGRQAIAERTRGQIARHVSPQVVDEVMENDAAYIEPRNTNAGILFADVVGFTPLAESLPASEIITILRGLHTRLGEAVFHHHGAIDKFLGDGLMATFGVTGRVSAGAGNMIGAGFDMVVAVEAWKAQRLAQGKPPITISVGVDYGPVVAGDVGDNRRLEFTVIGDTVNVAARVEEMTRQLATAMLVTDRALLAAKEDAQVRPILSQLVNVGEHTIRGRSGKMLLWALPKTFRLPGDGS